VFPQLSVGCPDQYNVGVVDGGEEELACLLVGFLVILNIEGWI
jgi:hypothetical protein